MLETRKTYTRPRRPKAEPLPEGKYIKIAAVSFINTVPLISGLENDERVQLTKAVPSGLMTILEQQKADVALVPSIDYQLARGDLRIIRAGGCIGALKESLTVRVFSKKPIGQIKTLACDTDSHTSVMLSRIVLKEIYDIVPDVSRLEYSGQAITNDTDAVLLIGDKVITAEISSEFRQYELDLAHAWQKMTGLGFVFAIWVCKPQFKFAEQAGEILRETLYHNLRRIGELAKQYAPEHNWPVEIAKKYLSQNMYYNFDAGQLKGLKLFYLKAHRHGLIHRHKMIRFL